jgi:hypothetical protein
VSNAITAKANSTVKALVRVDMPRGTTLNIDKVVLDTASATARATVERNIEGDTRALNSTVVRASSGDVRVNGDVVKASGDVRARARVDAAAKANVGKAPTQASAQRAPGTTSAPDTTVL